MTSHPSDAAPAGVAVVFGGSGFLGSHVADELVQRGYEVRVCDRVESPHLSPAQSMILLDLEDEKAVSAACEAADLVFNFAALADLDSARDLPRQTVIANVLGNVNVLEAVRANAVRRFIYASTVYVFSDAGSFYRISKQAAEAYTEEYGARFGVDYTILRFGSLYGRRATEGNTILKLLRSAFDTRVIEYEGSGEELREYIHVLDAARATVDIGASNELKNRRIVLTGHRAMRVRDVLDMISEILPFEVELRMTGSAAADHYRVTPYKYSPKVGEKYVVNPFVDMGQGILDCVEEVATLWGDGSVRP